MPYVLDGRSSLRHPQLQHNPVAAPALTNNAEPQRQRGALPHRGSVCKAFTAHQEEKRGRHTTPNLGPPTSWKQPFGAGSSAWPGPAAAAAPDTRGTAHAHLHCWGLTRAFEQHCNHKPKLLLSIHSWELTAQTALDKHSLGSKRQNLTSGFLLNSKSLL